MARLIILDRDGVINLDSPEFIKSPDEWRPIPGALDAIADLKHAGWLVVVCSNQSGVDRGIITPQALDAIHERLYHALAERHASLDGIAVCPHRPEENCHCRKPKPGMLLDMMMRFGAAPEETIAIGDSQRDLDAGQAAGCRCLLVRTGNGRDTERSGAAMAPEDVFDDLRSAADYLMDRPSC